MNFTILPNLTALGVLVAVFWAISRKATTQRVRLWLLGWFLILLHFAAAALPATASGIWPQLATAMSLGCLMLATVAFLTSVSSAVCDPRREAQFAMAVAVPALAYANGAILGVGKPEYYYCFIAVGALGPIVLLWRNSKAGVVGMAAGTVAVLAVAAVLCRFVLQGNPGLGVIVILAALNVSTAILFATHHHRATAGVLTAVSGFCLWALSFPAAVLTQRLPTLVKLESEVWNIPTYLVAIGMILTLLEDQIEKSTYLAYHDELTGLPNLRLLEDRLDQALAQASRSGGKVAVCVLDLDHFKEVNDTFGHRVGDLALCEVVSRLRARVRASDTLARSGGDEFTMVSQVGSRKAAETLISALESSLSEPIRIEAGNVRVGLSIGMAVFPEDGGDANELYAAADRAMYAVKKAGRRQAAAAAQIVV